MCCTEHLLTCSISSEGAGCSEKPGCFQRAFVGPEGIHPPGCCTLTQLALPSPANISLFSPISTPAGRFHLAPPDHRERASGASCRGETPRALESFPPYLSEPEFLALKANHQETPQYTSSHRKCRGFFQSAQLPLLVRSCFMYFECVATGHGFSLRLLQRWLGEGKREGKASGKQ